MATTTRESTLGSARRLERRGGTLVAVPHVVTRTGFKAPDAPGASAVFSAETTSAYFQHKVLGAVSRVSGDGRAGKALMPYDPDAPRNRPRESVRNTVGRRFGPSCAATLGRGERYRGASTVTLASSDARERASAWRTTNQVMYPRASVVETTGLDNPGISSAVAKRARAARSA
jgi:hypothetical protein